MTKKQTKVKTKKQTKVKELATPTPAVASISVLEWPNGKYEGRTTEFTVEDGKVYIADQYVERFRITASHRSALEYMDRQHRRYMEERFKELIGRETALWRDLCKDIGLSITDNLSFSNYGNYVTKLSKDQEPHRQSCDFCGEMIAAGQEMIDHRVQCTKDPYWMISFPHK